MQFSPSDEPIVLFGNGQPPVHPNEFLRLNKAGTILCTDGGADKLQQLGFKADYILGDMDSIIDMDNWMHAEKIILEDQSRTDLEKSLTWCVERGIRQLSLVGCSGYRDDHHQMSFLLLSIFSDQIQMEMVTNFSTIYCVHGSRDFECTPDQIISLIPKDYITKIKTTGLQYRLNNENLQYDSQGISNIAMESRFSIQTNGPVWVILNHPE